MMETRLRTQSGTAAPPSLTPILGRVLQRKCACGGSASLGGDCEDCNNQKLSLQRSLQSSEHKTRDAADVPPNGHTGLRSAGRPLDQPTRAFTAPGFGHDFNRVRVHMDSSAADSARALKAPDDSTARRGVFGDMQYLSEENLEWQTESGGEVGAPEPTGTEAVPSDGGSAGPATLPGTQTGGTGCDTSTGTTTSNVTNKDPCTMDCSASHEQKHAADIGPCCTKAGAAAAQVDKPEDKDAVQKKFENWMIDNANFLECRAYAVSITCGEAKRSKLKCPDSNDKCCGPLTRYVSSAMRQKEGTCNNAGQKLTDCPFP